MFLILSSGSHHHHQ